MTTTLDDLAAELASIRDERAIERLIYQYGHVLDFGTPEDYIALFTEDAVVEVHNALIKVLHLDIPFPAPTMALLSSRGAEVTPDGMAFRGHAALRRFVTRAEPRTARSLHVSTQPLVNLTGPDDATAVTYLRIYHHDQAGTPGLFTFGRYLDTLRRTSAGWRISRRICEL
ncbi:MAG: nuclear transport factor 2 family protein [Phenylobacterium sp.]|uniref:nuclear transport factor 2 family protein n=1 Tax=Phenylobacterium sp. TaxID=1871053 RepID=UPI0027370A9B|nr:nuclear transport factor 2 family protein [Phenylobacterium sp.]MDP3174662.1 nuclear transport factor 2 family protein [Phenylobacterium sp.]